MSDSQLLLTKLRESPCACGKRKSAIHVSLIGEPVRRSRLDSACDVVCCQAKCDLCGHEQKFSVLTVRQ